MNKQFLILQSIGIILVVLGHKGGIELFTDWFPAYSFHMPLFVFISGYFYKKDSDTKIIEFIKKKFKNLLIPYFIWNLIYGIMVSILIENNIVNFGTRLTLKSLFIDPWISGHQFVFNLSSWFVPMLFLVQVIYIIYIKFLKQIRISNNYLIMGMGLCIGCIGVIRGNHGYNAGINLMITRVMFLIPFYHMGYFYKEELEIKDTISNIKYFLMLFIIQFIIQKKYGYIGFLVSWCNDFNRLNILLPYITSITGIMFWLRISKILVKSIGDSKIIKYIGNNTWTIMMHHLFIFFMINTFFALIRINGFDYELYKNDIFYALNTGNNNFLLMYSILGIAIPLVIKYYIEKYKCNLKNAYKQILE